MLLNLDGDAAFACGKVVVGEAGEGVSHLFGAVRHGCCRGGRCHAKFDSEYERAKW